MARKRRSDPSSPAPRTARDRRRALRIAAGVLAASALAGCDGPRGVAGRAPNCPPIASSPREGSWDDPDGCWENRPDGQRVYRTVWGGHPFYYVSPPAYSRYWESESSNRGSRWFWGASAGHGGAHGAPSGAG